MPVTCADTTDIGHGREERRLRASSDVEWLSKVEDWPQVSSIALIEHERDPQSFWYRKQRAEVSPKSWTTR